MTERLHFDFSLSCIGEGNGNPLQYSCLENPRDGGAWWAAVYGVSSSSIEGMYLNIIKATYDKCSASIILNSEKLKAFPLKSEIRITTLVTST